MELLKIWILSVVVNIIYKTKVNINIYKSLADLGYIFKLRTLNEILEEELDEENTITQIIETITPFIPLYNIYKTIIKEEEYVFCAKEYISLFLEADIIEKMTKEEVNEYNKKKTGLNAIKLERKMHSRRKHYNEIKFDDNSSIWFGYKYESETDEELMDSIIIIEARGTYENLSEEELKQVVFNAHQVEEQIEKELEEEIYIEKQTNENNIERVIENNKVKTKTRKR